MTKPEITTERMLCGLDYYYPASYVDDEVRQAILASFTEYDNLKAEVEYWKETAEIGKSLKDEWKARAEKAEAEVERLKNAHTQMYAVAQEQADLARKAEAELEAARHRRR